MVYNSHITAFIQKALDPTADSLEGSNENDLMGSGNKAKGWGGSETPKDSGDHGMSVDQMLKIAKKAVATSVRKAGFLPQLNDPQSNNKRVYVHDPSEAPPGVQLIPGKRGGQYYEAPQGAVTPPQSATSNERAKPAVAAPNVLAKPTLSNPQALPNATPQSGAVQPPNTSPKPAVQSPPVTAPTAAKPSPAIKPPPKATDMYDNNSESGLTGDGEEARDRALGLPDPFGLPPSHAPAKGPAPKDVQRQMDTDPGMKDVHGLGDSDKVPMKEEPYSGPRPKQNPAKPIPYSPKEKIRPNQVYSVHAVPGGPLVGAMKATHDGRIIAQFPGGKPHPFKTSESANAWLLDVYNKRNNKLNRSLDLSLSQSAQASSILEK